MVKTGCQGQRGSTNGQESLDLGGSNLRWYSHNMAASTYQPVLGRTGLANPNFASNFDSSLSASPLTNMAYHLTLIFIVLLIGRVPEITTLFIGSSFYQILILNVVLMAFLVITGTLVRVGATGGGTLVIAFHLWILFTLPFSGYRRGSLDAFINLLPLIPSFLFIAGFLSRNADTLRKGLFAMACAGAVGVGYLHKVGAQMEEDRYSAGQGTFGNSNLVAIYLLMLTPIWALVAANSKYKWIVRLIFLGLIADGFSIVLQTGSRSGFMTMGLMLVLLFVGESMANKAKILVVTVLGVFLALGAMTDNLKSRIGTIFNSEAKDETSAEAMESSSARMALLMESIDVTMRHPLVGAGFGVYSETSAAERQKKGLRGLWQVTHNLYTQVSSEVGFPGFFIYISGVIWCLRTIFRVKGAALKSPDLAPLYPMARALGFCWVVFLFNGVFTSMAVDFFYYVLTGYTIALSLVFQNMRRQQSQNAMFGNTVAAPRSSRFFPAPAAAALPAPAMVPVGIGSGDQAPLKTDDAPWRRNPRKHPPGPGAPSR